MATIRSYVKPQRLYRYRSLKHFDREIYALKHGYLFCAAYLDLNDPMEGLFNSSKLLKQSPEYRAIRETITDNKSQIGMCSFSEVHDHELMWAHYADQFRGICISYSFPSLLKYLGRSVSFVRMYYNETAPTVHRYEKDPARLAKKILSYKNYRWLYEREWRMFAPLGKARYQKIDCVTSVYLGSRISDLDRERITRDLEKLNIEIREMRINKYSISFETA